ncbi:MAG TPA: CheR family methyltransferase, partial [Kofleriaceae bacterium]|nr:CheR family methyltransferase [Kofleriaceae bacterium]
MPDARQLAKRLRDAAPVPVVDVQRSMTLQPEHIYVLPKDREIAIHKSWLAIDQPDGHGSRDRLLRSLADSLGPDCAAVILAGRGSDGVLGAKRVKEAGGITICQAGVEDEANELPRIASATGIIDLVLPVPEIGPRLVSLTRESEADGPEEPFGAAGTGDGEAFAEILMMLYARTGNDFNAYRRGTLFRRLLRRMLIAEVGSIDAYSRYLRDHPTELDRLFRELLVSVTDFFRDPQAFELLANDIVPRLFKGKGAGDQIRVWVPGCATGEEAYSLAMLLNEHASRTRNAPTIQLFATDIDEEALREARVGIYPDAIATDVSEERLQRFFTHEQDHYRVSPALRGITEFSAQNVLRDPPFSRLDLVASRGLLLELNDDAQEHALETFHFALRPDGLLLLGPGERARDSHFTPIDEKHHIYQRRTSPFRRVSPRTGTSSVAVAATPSDPGELHDHALAHYALASVLIDGTLDVLHTNAPARAYFKYSAGELTRSILRLVHPALSPALGRAIYAAREPGRGTVIR